MALSIVIKGQKRFIEEIIPRKKLKQSYEYEVSLKGSENIWLPRDELLKRGLEKKDLEVDTRETQRLGLLRPLIRREIEKHFADFGLDPEFLNVYPSIPPNQQHLIFGKQLQVEDGRTPLLSPICVCVEHADLREDFERQDYHIEVESSNTVDPPPSPLSSLYAWMEACRSSRRMTNTSKSSFAIPLTNYRPSFQPSTLTSVLPCSSSLACRSSYTLPPSTSIPTYLLISPNSSSAASSLKTTVHIPTVPL